MKIVFIFCISVVVAGPTKSYKDQYCTDPRTMEKHEVYQEWADAYSCTRHRCQPGGRNLAIYTVGCKRVEAPESAIECEEVVEDTNMQFPYCCTRLRCLVVVRGEVWTKVLGQPWENLPAAPWSHMYKMKKPAPAEQPKGIIQGPIYEIQSENNEDKVLRSSKVSTSKSDCQDIAIAPRVAVSPDFVIALQTTNDEKEKKQFESLRRKHSRRTTPVPEESDKDQNIDVGVTEMIPSESEEKYYRHGVTEKGIKNQEWTEIPQSQWNDHEKDDALVVIDTADAEEKQEKPALQALVDAIGSRMRDIENVVQKMSEKVQNKVEPFASLENRISRQSENDGKTEQEEKEYEKDKAPNKDDHYKRFSVRNRSRYLGGTTETSDQPIFVDDGYFSDASNVIRRANPPKEPPTYMAPVENRRHHEILETKHKKKHLHKKHGKGHKKHHSKDDKRKHNKITSNEEKNIVSLEDTSDNK
ncbi:uncharacterized protein LOC125062672 [Pieris napi]|uniref:uncharacterized protein LOC125062672 n=1 Tax=Pieris napi TaxID=78633 RepID=UPI001FBA9B9C|nr:uncharacterized protein LOC125062672 [Pieris napi]